MCCILLLREFKRHVDSCLWMATNGYNLTPHYKLHERKTLMRTTWSKHQTNIYVSAFMTPTFGKSAGPVQKYSPTLRVAVPIWRGVQVNFPSGELTFPIIPTADECSIALFSRADASLRAQSARFESACPGSRVHSKDTEEEEGKAERKREPFCAYLHISEYMLLLKAKNIFVCSNTFFLSIIIIYRTTYNVSALLRMFHQALRNEAQIQRHK